MILKEMAEKELEKYSKILLLHSPFINKNNVIALFLITRLKISGIFTDDFDEVVKALTNPPDNNLNLNENTDNFTIFDCIETYNLYKHINFKKVIVLSSLGVQEEDVKNLNPDLIIKLSLSYDGPEISYKITFCEDDKEINEKLKLYQKLYPLDKHLIYPARDPSRNPEDINKNYSVIHITNALNYYGMYLLFKTLKYDYNINTLSIMFYIIIGKNTDDYIKMSEKLQKDINYFYELNSNCKKFGIRNSIYVIE